MGRETFGEVRDESGVSQKGSGRSRYIRGSLGRVGAPSLRSGKGRGTLWVVEDGLGTIWGPLEEVRDMSGYPRGGLGRAGGPSWSSETGRFTLWEDQVG